MPDQEPLISVIVPIYQIERYVGICIESILHQTYTNLEILLVDDGSPDRCPEICDLYARKDARIRVLHKENGGLVSARKAGLSVAKGAYIGYVDGDDWIAPDFYETLLRQLQHFDCDVVCAGQSRDIFEQSVQLGNPYPTGIYRGRALEQLRQQMLSYGDFYQPGVTTYVWNKLFRREVLFDCQMAVDERISIGEDAAVTYPVLMHCESVCICDCTGYHYRQREDSMLKKCTGFADDQKKLQYLHRFLSGFAAEYGGNLQQQVDDYVLGLCIMRSGGRLPDDSFSTFGSAYYGKRVVVYSAGTFGQHLMHHIRGSGHCTVAGWIDDDYWEYRRCCLNVDPVEQIQTMAYDYVLIAAVSRAAAEEARRRLQNCGTAPEQILTVACDPAKRAQLVRQYLN